MKNGVKKVFLIALAALVVLGAIAGCSRGSSRTETSLKELVYPLIVTRELQTFNILYSQRAEDSENLTNLVDGLLQTDPWGTLLPALATDWGTNDGGLTWTFRLRQGVKWVDMGGNPKADVVAQDWATALEWILNFHKNDSTNTSMPIELIQGAEDYYEWTKTLSPAEGNALRADRNSRFMQMVGIQIPDNQTIIYTCTTPKPYFHTIALYQVLYPMSQAMVDELGGPDNVRSMDNRNMWYNGAYTMTTFIHSNEKVFTKNPLYWDTASDRFDTVTIKMVDSTDVSYQLYLNGDVDYTLLSESNLNTIWNNPNHQFHDYLIPDPMSKYSYQMHLNFDKRLPGGAPDTNWNTAVANTAFRRAWFYGLNLVDYWKRTNAINPMLMENNYFTMVGLINTSDGIDYTDHVRMEMGLASRNGVTPARLDAAKFAQYKEQAMRELRALGVTFPVTVDHYVSGSNQTAIDTATLLKQLFTQYLGDDFMVLQINTFVNNYTQEVRNPQLQSIYNSGWGADYGDPMNYLAQMTYGDDNAFYSVTSSNINKVAETPATRELINIYREFTRLVRAADAISTDLDARYKAFAKAEAYMLDNAIVIPLMYQQMMALGRVDNTSRMKAMYGIQDMKFKNWRTNVNGVSTAEAAAAAALHAQGRR